MFKVEFSTDNAAFDESAADECAHILRVIAAKVAIGATGGAIHDSNGNRIGDWAFDGTESA